VADILLGELRRRRRAAMPYTVLRSGILRSTRPRRARQRRYLGGRPVAGRQSQSRSLGRCFANDITLRWSD